MKEIKSYQFLTKKQAAKIIMWSLFNRKSYLIYAEGILQGKRAVAAYEDALISTKTK